MEEPTVNPRWRKSSYSSNGGANCVEAGHVPGAVLIRDTTQHGRGPVLRVRWRRAHGLKIRGDLLAEVRRLRSQAALHRGEAQSNAGSHSGTPCAL